MQRRFREVAVTLDLTDTRTCGRLVYGAITGLKMSKNVSIKVHAKKLAVRRVHAMYEGRIAVKDAAALTEMPVRDVRRYAEEAGLEFYIPSKAEIHNADEGDLLDNMR